MFLNKPAEKASNLIDQVSQSADQAIQSTQQTANDALQSISHAMQDLRRQATPVAEHALDGVCETTHHLRIKAERASENTVARIQHDPVKSVLLAAVTGAALMALVGLLSQPRKRR